MERTVGDLDEVLNNLGVFRSSPDDLIATCPSGFRRVPITQGPGYYISLQGFAPNQPAFAHTHPDSEEWVAVVGGTGRALLASTPLELVVGTVVGRAAMHPHGFESGPQGLRLLSMQLPRPVEGATTWDRPGETTAPIECAWGGTCRRCPRCGGHSKRIAGGRFGCENCTLDF